MPITYILNGQISPVANIGTFFANAQQQGPNAGGPMPGRLLAAKVTKELGAIQTHLQPINAVGSNTIIIGLITCAAVLYVSRNAGAIAGVWLHHANAGHGNAADVAAARVALGNPPWGSIEVIFGHPRAQGIQTNNIVEIPDMVVPLFGVDNLGSIGF